MKLVIDIEEAIYKECIPYKDTPIISNLANYNSEIIHAIANGTPLPKGHGWLIPRTLPRSTTLWPGAGNGQGSSRILQDLIWTLASTPLRRTSP